MPPPSKLYACDECMQHFSSKPGLFQHKTWKHGSSKNKPTKETAASNDITLDSTADTTWNDPSTNIAQQFVASIVQKEQINGKNQSDPVKELVEQSIYGLDMDFPYFHMINSLIDQQFVAMERNPLLATFLKKYN